MRRNKYGAKAVDGFPSKMERSVWLILKAREESGEITDITRQKVVVLQDGPKEVRINWKIDFTFMKDGELHYCEAKGFPTNDFLLKLKLFRKQRPGPLEVWVGDYRRPQLDKKLSVP